MANQPSIWERLQSIATLGTRRAPLSQAIAWPDPSLARAAADVSHELALLRLAAATRLWQLAGARSSVRAVDSRELIGDRTADDPLDVPAVPEIRVSEAAAWRLARMIAGEHKEFIEEWFEHAATGRKSLAPQWLPVVLEGVDRKIRDRFPGVLGAAAEWLSRQHPAWSVVPSVTEPSEQRWLEGTLDERRAELRAIRQAEPSRAIQWLQATWDADPAEAREAFLKTLHDGLSLADEPFLEAALDDKRKGVRLAAIELLSRLEGSQHARRSRERIAPYIVLEEHKGMLSKLRGRKLTIDLPTSIDRPAQRDGIELKPPAQRKIGERSFWLVQMAAFVAPHFWSQRFAVDSKSFVDAAMSTEYAQDLLSSLSEAAVRHPTSEWLDALCDAWLDSKQEPVIIAQAIAQLIEAAPTKERGTLLTSKARKLATKDANAFICLLDSIEIRWSEDITKFALEHIATRARGDRQQYSHARNTLDTWGRRCDVSTAAILLPDIVAATGEQSPWRNAFEQLNDIVEFRAAMRRELT